MDDKQLDELMQHLRNLEELIHRWMRLRRVALVALVLAVVLSGGFVTAAVLFYLQAGQAARDSAVAVESADKARQLADTAYADAVRARQEAVLAGDSSNRAETMTQDLRLQIDQLTLELARLRRDFVDEAAARELEKLQGAWTATAFTEDGKPVEKELDAIRLVVTGDQSTFTRGGVTRTNAYRLDPTRKPKTIDIVRPDGPDKDTVLRGIYRLQDGRLEICHATGKERPTEFASKPGSGLVYEVWKRDKP